MTDSINLDTLGVPVPIAWQVQQLRTDDGKWYVKQVVMTPVGVFAFLWEGDDAQMLASQLRTGGRNASAGTWTPVAAGQATSPPRQTNAGKPISGAEGAGGRA